MYKDLRKYIQQIVNPSLDTILLSGPKYIKLLVRLLQQIGLPFWAQVFNDTLCDIDNLTSYINGDHKYNLFTNPKQFRSFTPRKEEISAKVPGYENLGQYSQIEEILISKYDGPRQNSLEVSNTLKLNSRLLQLTPESMQSLAHLIKATFKAVLNQYDNATSLEDNITIPDLRPARPISRALGENSSTCLSTICYQVCHNRLKNKNTRF